MPYIRPARPCRQRHSVIPRHPRRQPARPARGLRPPVVTPGHRHLGGGSGGHQLRRLPGRHPHFAAPRALAGFAGAGAVPRPGMAQAQARSIDEANLQFKVQVQEWKNVLLRGKQPQDMEKYWGQFQDRQRDVQGILARLVTQTSSDPTLSRRIDTLRQEHLQLGAAYQRGRDAYVAAGADRSMKYVVFG